MKLLDPFAGYRLASGHPFFHIALFAGSFMMNVKGDTEYKSQQEIIDAFNLLRWGHLLLIILAIFEMYAN